MADIKEKDKEIKEVKLPAGAPATKSRTRKKAAEKTEKPAENALPEDPRLLPGFGHGLDLGDHQFGEMRRDFLENIRM